MKNTTVYCLHLGPKTFLFEYEADKPSEAAASVLAEALLDEASEVPQSVTNALFKYGITKVTEFTQELSYEELVLSFWGHSKEIRQNCLNINSIKSRDVDPSDLQLVETVTEEHGRRVFYSIDSALNQMVRDNDLNVRWLMELKAGNKREVIRADFQARFL